MSSSRPRRLRPDELDYIVDVIPPIVTNPQEIGQIIRLGYQKRLRYKLSRLNVAPTGVDKIRREILRQYEDSLVQPGDPVGVGAAGAFGETMTQSTLNTFHHTGQASNVTTGIKGFEELIRASPVRSKESVTLHFINKRLDLRGVLMYKNELVHLTVRDIVIEYTSVNYSQFFGDGFPYWYRLYLNLHNIDTSVTEGAGWFLRLYLDTEIIYSRGLTMASICDQIEKINSPSSVLCIPSPLNLGIIDIYPISVRLKAPRARTQMTIPERNLAFLQIVVLRNLDKITLQGIDGINELIPAYDRVWGVTGDQPTILDERYESDQEVQEITIGSPTRTLQKRSIRKRWRIDLNERKFRSSGMSIEHVIRLLQAVNVSISEIGVQNDNNIYDQEVIRLANNYNIPVRMLSSEDDHNLNYIERLNKEMFIRPIWILMPAIEEESIIEWLTSVRNRTGNEDDRQVLTTVLAAIKNETYENRKWRFQLDQARLKDGSVAWTDIYLLLKKLDINYDLLNQDENNIELELNLHGKNPTAYINGEISRDRNDEETERENGNPRPPSEIRLASRYYYAFTEGTNLSELLQQDFVDQQYTYSNNSWYNLEAFGIEATRNFLIMEFLAVIGADGASVNIQHVLMLVDYMTRTGTITKISPHGVINRSVGVLTKSTVAQAMTVFLKAAAFGERDISRDVSSAIMVGKVVNIGTAFGNNEEFEAVRNRLQEKLRRGDFTPLANETEEAIENMASLNNGLQSQPGSRITGESLEPTISVRLPPPKIVDQAESQELIINQGRVSNQIPNQKIVNHLKNIINPIGQMPCVETPESTGDIIHIQPEITSVRKTTNLPTITRPGEPSVDQPIEVSFTLPIPHPNTTLPFPRTLTDSIAAARQIDFPEIRSPERPSRRRTRDGKVGDRRTRDQRRVRFIPPGSDGQIPAQSTGSTREGGSTGTVVITRKPGLTRGVPGIIRPSQTPIIQPPPNVIQTIERPQPSRPQPQTLIRNITRPGMVPAPRITTRERGISPRRSTGQRGFIGALEEESLKNISTGE